MTGALSGLGVEIWFAAAYCLVLVGLAYVIDALARRAGAAAEGGASFGFTYHEDHDAWLCPEDQWLWPQSFDPDHRVMRYRASPSVCNACPVKETCTPSRSGREVQRAVDSWPASEAARSSEPPMRPSPTMQTGRTRAARSSVSAREGWEGVSTTVQRRQIR